MLDELFEVQQQIATLQAKEKQLKKQIIDQLGAGVHAEGVFQVSVSKIAPSVRTDYKKLAMSYATAHERMKQYQTPVNGTFRVNKVVVNA